MNRRTCWEAGLFVVLVAAGIFSRLVKDSCPLLPPNFHAIVGTSLFAGFIFRNRVVALAVPVVAMLLSDMKLGGYDAEVMTAVYGALALPILWRGVLRSRLSPARVGACTLACSLVFYLATNLAVWHAWYPHTWAGLSRCYLVALPFLAYTLAGDLTFAALFFGAYAWAHRTEPAAARGLSLVVST